MRMQDLILVSVDDHVVEPPQMFDRHIPAKCRDRAPRVVRKQDGSDVWLFEGRRIPNIGLNAVAGRPPQEYGVEPTAYDQLRPGCYDLAARIGDMNANGVLGSMCFPSFPAFCGQVFHAAQDKDLALAVLQAYNDWHIDEWCGGAPGRFIPLAIAPIWDPARMAAEVRRVARKGCHAISFSENPEKLDLLWSPVLRKFASLKFALSEAGVGWVPFFLERVDYVYARHRAWTHQDFGGKLPSEVFREHVVLCFISDRVGIENRHAVGVENITWECDYPHSDTIWPRAPESLMAEMQGVPDGEIDQITHANAMRLFRYDPFRHVPRQQATVGALRAQAVDVDLGLKSHGGLKPNEDGDIVTTGQVVKQLATTFMKAE